MISINFHFNFTIMRRRRIKSTFVANAKLYVRSVLQKRHNTGFDRKPFNFNTFAKPDDVPNDYSYDHSGIVEFPF